MSRFKLAATGTALLAVVLSVMGIYTTDAWELTPNTYTVLDKSHSVTPCGKNNASHCDMYQLSVETKSGVSSTRFVEFDVYSSVRISDEVTLQERIPGTEWKRKLQATGIMVGVLVLIFSWLVF